MDPDKLAKIREIARGDALDGFDPQAAAYICGHLGVVAESVSKRPDRPESAAR
jgi:hypothetical protein